MAALEIKYTLDGVSFETLGIIVTSAKGMYDKAEAKDTLSAEWDGIHGVIRDLSAVKYKGRNLELTCAMEAAGWRDFVGKVQELIALLDGGLHTLQYTIGGQPTITRTVYCSNQVDISKEWDPNKMVGTFTLKLEEVTPGTVYSRPSVKAATEPTDNDVHYYLDGYDLSTFNVMVKSSKGLFCKPQEKDNLTMDWYGEHGVEIDRDNVRYQERTIELSCYCGGVNYASWILSISRLLQLISGSGTHRLRVKATGIKALVYEVYHPSELAVETEWDATKCGGTFTLKLVEPEPVKTVIGFSQGTATITIASTSPVNIYWGDGQYAYDVSGDGSAVTLTHTYSGSYECIITGETSDIQSLTHNGILLWSRLV